MIKRGKVIFLQPSEDGCEVFRKALAQRPERIRLAPGEYVFRKKDAARIIQAVSNTLVFGQEPVRHFGILLDEINDLVIEGNGAILIFDGDMSAIALRNCNNVRLENLVVDYRRPRVSEMTVIESGTDYADFAIHPDSLYGWDSEGRFYLINADGAWENQRQIVQCAFQGRNLRISFDPVRESASSEVVARNIIRFTYKRPVKFNPGEVYQFRDPTRNEVGILIHDCRDTELNQIQLRFTPGLGVVAQLCRNLTIGNHRHEPDPASGRICAAFADCVQVSSCRGMVVIQDSVFAGTQDDPVNIHGTYLGIEYLHGNELTVRFMHQETWGIVPFEPGDRIAFVDSGILQRLEYNEIAKVDRIDELRILLTLKKTPERNYISADMVVENLTANPDVLVQDCVFKYYPTRGLLLSSAGKCEVYNNTFMHSSKNPAILIAGDARSWYESGGVRDVKICGNYFHGCRSAAIAIAPEVQRESNKTVHENIEISGNHFEDCREPCLQHTHTAGLCFVS